VTRRLMIVGAGSSGRGQLGQLAHDAGWELVLADRDQALVDRLRRAGRYTVRLHREHSFRDVIVDRFRAYPVSDTVALTREGLDLSLLLTCCFSQNLPAIAPLAAAIIAARQAAGVRAPLNVICCENMQHGSAAFRAMVLPLLSPEAAAYAAERVGFPDCMISRVVPVAAADPLLLAAEDYSEWTVDQRAFRGPPVDLPAMELVPNQDARLARKFFMHNSTHAVCGYQGFHRGHEFIHQALGDPVVLAHVTGAIDELAPVVARRYGFTAEDTRRYGLELGPRGAIAALRDPILRVVRDPLRKLSRDERLVAPAVMALEDGSPALELVGAIVAALRYVHPDDPQSVALNRRLASEGLARVASDVLGLEPGHPLVRAVIESYERWEDCHV
jgi:mannitol-1-phosphate 5-dehydrogenase